jgi:hypothetical protein
MVLQLSAIAQARMLHKHKWTEIAQARMLQKQEWAEIFQARNIVESTAPHQ